MSQEIPHGSQCPPGVVPSLHPARACSLNSRHMCLPANMPACFCCYHSVQATVILTWEPPPSLTGFHVSSLYLTVHLWVAHPQEAVRSQRQGLISAYRPGMGWLLSLPSFSCITQHLPLALCLLLECSRQSLASGPLCSYSRPGIPFLTVSSPFASSVLCSNVVLERL